METSSQSLKEAINAIVNGAEEIDISDEQIGDQGALRLAEALEKNETVTDCYLDGNCITDAAVGKLAKILQSHKTLRTFSLYKNNVSDAGASLLADAITTSSLETLDLRENKVGDDGAQAFAQALQNGSRIRYLLLNHNYVGDTGAAFFADAVRACGKDGPLRQLDLEGNSIKTAGWTALKEVKDSLKKEIQFGYQRSKVREQHASLIETEGKDGVFASR
eukprot:TRINITY_DN50358_c0_g1_i1.p1 TRINITY_DN50358_c0_g1~~TRINITY_DN50358_c0_g1_i1.p1  ORF type:complete len:220 (-),score=53.10 TRINITY_DN50358_c0_g1_i1:25-684(-)